MSERAKFILLVLLLVASVVLAIYVNSGFRDVLISH